MIDVNFTIAWFTFLFSRAHEICKIILNMKFTLHWPDYIVFAFWLFIYTLIGIYHRYRAQIKFFIKSFSRKNATKMDEVQREDTEEIFFGNRQLTLFPVTCSVIASFLSAIALMGTAAEAYLYGIQFCLMMIPYVAAFSLTSEVYMPVFYKLRLKSAQEYLEFRFGKVVRSVVSLVFCFQMWVYVALALYAPSLAFSQVSGLPIWMSLISTGLVTTFYTAMGGIRAVVWTDVIQLLLLALGMVLVIVLGIVKIGGIDRVWLVSLEGLRLQSFNFSPNPFLRHTFWTLTVGGTGMVLSIYATNQTQVQRYLACRDLRTARLSILLNIPFNCIFLIVQLASGLVTYVYFSGCDPVTSKQVTKSDQLLPYFIMALFDGVPVIRGLFLSVIFAAALSTVSSGVNSLANVVLEDIVQPLCTICCHKRISKKVKSFLAIGLSITVGISTIGLAFLYTIMGPQVLQFSFSIFGAVGGPVLSIFTLGILSPCVNAKGGLVGFLCSLAVGLWLSLSAVIYPPTSPVLPLSVANCSSHNVTVPSMTAVAVSSNAVSSISYLHYTPICLLVAAIVSVLVSAIFGFNTKSPVPSCLLAWQAVACYRRFHNRLPSQWVYSDVYVDPLRKNENQVTPSHVSGDSMMVKSSILRSNQEGVENTMSFCLKQCKFS